MQKIKLAIAPEQIVKLFTTEINTLNINNPLLGHQQKRLSRLDISSNNVISHNWGVSKKFSRTI